MASSATKRIWYAKYACQKSGPFPWIEILGKDKRKVTPVAIEAFTAFDQALARTEYDARVVGTYNCRAITGGRKLSLHAYGIAVDLDPYSFGNPYYGRSHPKGWKFSWSETKFTPNQVQSVEAIRTNSGKKVWLWGGRWNTIKDYMHWELDVPPKDLETGINWKTVPGGGTLAFLSEEAQKFFEATFQDMKAELDPKTSKEWGTVLIEDYRDRKANPNGGLTEEELDERYVRRGIQQTLTFK